jgi:signal transduction histidine kinase
MEAGKLSLEYSDVLISDLISEVADIAWGGAQDKQITIDQVCPAGDAVVRADRERLLQALNNLVGNSLKFTPRGGRITIGAVRDERGIRFYVTDTGAGIPKDQLPRIFERYWQARHARSAGAGLGLAIVRGIAHAHGGEVLVRSEVGKGSTFEIVLGSTKPS